MFVYLRYLNSDKNFDAHSNQIDNKTVEDKVNNLEYLIKSNKK